MTEIDTVKYNQSAWDNYVDRKDRWTIPVSKEVLLQAKNGNWSVVLTPVKAVPHSWFPELKGLKILGLASGGGQQGPVLATLGADITIFDNSEKQLLQDKIISDQFQLGIKTIQGNMQDLSVIPSGSFDLVFNPCSLVFVDDILPVWKECYRVLKPGGILMTGLINPLTLQLKENSLEITYRQPFSDIHSLPKEKLEELKSNREALIFGHSLTDQIGGQLKEGFRLTDFYEDDWGGTNVVDPYFPSFIATRAVK